MMYSSCYAKNRAHWVIAISAFSLIIPLLTGVCDATQVTSSLVTFEDPRLKTPRTIGVAYLVPDKLVPCRVYYTKNNRRKQVGHYNNEIGECEDIQKRMISRMKDAYDGLTHTIYIEESKPDRKKRLNGLSSDISSAEDRFQILLEEFTTFEHANMFIAYLKRQYPNVETKLLHNKRWSRPFRIVVGDGLSENAASTLLNEAIALEIGNPTRMIKDAVSRYAPPSIELHQEWERYATASCYAEGNNTVKKIAECANVVIDEKLLNSCLKGGLCDPRSAVSDQIAQLNDKLVLSLNKNLDLGILHACLKDSLSDREKADCGLNQLLTNEQKKVYECAKSNADEIEFVKCAGKGVLSADAKLALDCTEKHGQDSERLAACILEQKGDKNTAIVARCLGADNKEQCLLEELSGKELSHALKCQQEHAGDSEAIALCVAGNYMDENERKALRCAMESDSLTSAAMCAALGQIDLTPEQRIALECAAQSGGNPYAFAGCYGWRTTIRELTKCLTDGIGGDGCFGKNNTLVKVATNAYNDVTKGPGKGNEIVKLREGILGNDNGEVARLIRDPIKRSIEIQGNLLKGATTVAENAAKEVKKHVDNAAKDVTKGPGENNDLVGRKGWLRSRLGF